MEASFVQVLGLVLILCLSHR